MVSGVSNRRVAGETALRPNLPTGAGHPAVIAGHNNQIGRAIDRSPPVATEEILASKDGIDQGGAVAAGLPQRE
jgi:hypothetical protein